MKNTYQIGYTKKNVLNFKVVVVLEKAPKKDEKNGVQTKQDQVMILQQLKAEVKECLQLANNIGERIKKVEETIV